MKRILKVLALILLVFGPALTFAQGRINDKDIESLMKNLNEDAKQFRSSFNSAIGKSTIRKTSQEKDAKALVERFQKQTDGLLKEFKSTKKADQALPVVLQSSDNIDRILIATPLDARTNTQWAKVKTELGTLSNQFGIHTSAQPLR